ncbi:MAG: hypothetical protein JXB49_05625 [Bacteroidales bacterium]|nr:hypothetical protein [Bacteroidales bacterium]MBN2818795.1 hypothetical protein [Bacteroidales bacterium]
MQKISANGRLYYCKNCSKVHFEFLNKGVDFEDFKAVKEFTKFLFSLNYDYYQEKNKTSRYRKKIIIPFPDEKARLFLNIAEVEELKKLFESFILERYKREDRSEFKGFLSYTIDFPKASLN